MKKSTFFISLLFCGFISHAQNVEAYFLSQPALTPDGQQVIFSFEGDLWKANVKDGQASRLTAMQGYETGAKVSPDGRWIAFTGRQFGNADIYVMPVDGGEIKQLTFHSANDEVSSWGWDNKIIYFTSNRYSRMSGYTVNKTGGTPEKIFGDYFFQYDHNPVEHPVSGEIYFSDTWESSFQQHRKRYKGAFNPNIQSYNQKTKKYIRYTDWEGKDFHTTIDKNGNIFFISDEANGQYNLYTFRDGKKTGLTKFNTSIKAPFVNANGEYVVFEKDYQLWLYNIKTDKTEKLKISLVRNSVLPQHRDFNVKGNITNFDISPDGKKIAFTSRGEIFVSDVEGKFIQQVNKGSAERAREVKWLADNKTLLFNKTKNGYLNWYTIAADGTTRLKELTNDLQNNRAIELNKKRTQAVYLGGRNEVRLINLKDFQDKLLVKDEIWGFQNSLPGFSPNDEYVVFTAYRNFEQDILIHHIKQNKTINLTNTAITESGPIWSPDGKYIYFNSSRLKASYPMGMQNSKIYRLSLEKLDEPFHSNKFDELFEPLKKDTTEKKDSVDKINIDVNDPIVVNMDNIMERLDQISPPFGTQFLQYIYQKGDKTNIFYTSDHGEGKNALWKTIIQPFEMRKTEKIAGAEGTFSYSINVSGDKLYVLSSGNISKLNLDQNKVEPINITHTFRRNLQQEFEQAFEETWAQVQENFYDQDFHGINWVEMKKYYQRFVPYLNNRADLRVLLNDMLGELNSSHQGFSSSGVEESTGFENRTMETGIIFENSDPYKVKYIVNRSNADNKDIDIKPGDLLIEVNGLPIDKNADRNFYFTQPSIDREVKLTFNRKGKEVDVKIHPQSSLLENFYDEWIDVNQQRVNEKSNNRIAYTHMKNMGQGEFENFLVDMSKELNQKDALILDLRYNTGGNVHDQVINFLSQKSYLKWKYREGQYTQQPNFAPSDKPIILLINEQSLSDAEMTAEGFKTLKLGKIVGTETYRWIIFTSGVGLVDGSFVRIPAWGCYTLDGKNLEMTGVAPDIDVVNSFDDKLTGKDPQLDLAIEELKKMLK